MNTPSRMRHATAAVLLALTALAAPTGAQAQEFSAVISPRQNKGIS